MTDIRVVVTGGAGFIGSHLVRALICRPEVAAVCVLDNLVHAQLVQLDDVLDDPKFEFIEGDIRDPKQLRRAFQQVGVVFHLAAQSNVMGSVQNSDYCFSTNVYGTYLVLNAAIQAGIRRVVFTSSREVYGESAVIPVAEHFPLVPKNEYGASKIAAETYCQLYQNKLDISVLRLSNVYGPGDEGRVVPTFIHRAVNNLSLDLYGGEQIIDFVWVGHVVDALVRAGLSQGVLTEPVNIASGEGTSLRTLANQVKLLLGVDSPINILPARSPEVVRFVADTTRMRTCLGLDINEDSLLHLPDVINSYRLLQHEALNGHRQELSGK